MTKHKIGWLNMPGYKPETWNPIVGCSKVSPGCDNCYAERMANRLSVALGAKGTEPSDSWIAYSDVITKGHWNGKTALVKSALDKPLKWKEPRMIFVCSMCDLFHENVLFRWIDAVYDIIRDCPQHRFIILTKRPERMKEWSEMRTNVYNNLWIGVTAENQEQANKRIPILLQIPAAKHFVSIEPMLGPVDLTRLEEGISLTQDVLNGKAHSLGEVYTEGPKLDWVICGGETGHKARPMHPDWVRSLRDQCKAAGVPFFFKQWGEWRHAIDTDRAKTNQWSWICENGKVEPGLRRLFEFEKLHHSLMIKVGRKAAGNMLDGEQHQEWPKNK